MKEILILENHLGERKKIQSAIEKATGEVEIYSVETEEEAYKVLMQKEINLFIVDIVSGVDYYGDISGLKFVQNIRRIEKYCYTPVIVLTNLEDPGRYIINELHCFGWLEKPFVIDLLGRLIKDALNIPVNRSSGRNIYFKQDGVICALKVDEIIYIENRERNLLIHTVEEELMIKYETAKQFLKKIGDHRLLQCSRQVIINVDYISKVDFVNRIVTLKEINEMVEIGSSMKNKFKHALKCSNDGLWLGKK